MKDLRVTVTAVQGRPRALGTSYNIIKDKYSETCDDCWIEGLNSQGGRVLIAAKEGLAKTVLSKSVTVLLEHTYTVTNVAQINRRDYRLTHQSVFGRHEDFQGADFVKVSLI
jgi:hypothetical protein